MLFLPKTITGVEFPTSTFPICNIDKGLVLPIPTLPTSKILNLPPGILGASTFNKPKPLILKAVSPAKLLFNLNDPLTNNEYAPGVIVFIPKLVAVIICLSVPFILYKIVHVFAPGVGSPPESIRINTLLFTLEFAPPNVLYL